MTTTPRTGQAPPKLNREKFHEQFQKSFIDPTFIPVRDALAEVEEVAWNNYHEKGHKAALTEKAGREFFKLARGGVIGARSVVDQVVQIDRNGRIRGLYNGTMATDVPRMIADIDILLQER
ncbi:MAG: hypothetical protein EOO68_04455 [Moraxellaceae bacterium]|nr:MAG: hypothetical protein EOO68_04455 [Moraxellaceae bacterium]